MSYFIAVNDAQHILLAMTYCIVQQNTQSIRSTSKDLAHGDRLDAIEGDFDRYLAVWFWFMHVGTTVNGEKDLVSVVVRRLSTRAISCIVYTTSHCIIREAHRRLLGHRLSRTKLDLWYRRTWRQVRRGRALMMDDRLG